MTIRIVLADDHRMFREALRTTLAADSGIEIVAEAGNAAETLACLPVHQPDVLVLDIALPDRSGIEVARAALSIQPGLRIVALSGYADRMFVEEMLQAGAGAYVVKSAGADELVLAIRAAMKGQIFLSPEITGGMLARSSPDAAVPPPLSVLGPRERAVLRLLAQGLRSAEIAADLGIAATTVDVHRRNIKRKLGIGSIAELTRYAVREGLAKV